MITKDAIGDKVRAFIADTYGSQADAGRILGMHPTTLSGAIKGKWLPNEKVLRAMGLQRVDVKDATGKIINTYYEEEDEVKLKKFNQLHRGMSSISKKVYEIVPLDSSMSLQQIVTAFGKTGAAPFAVIEACLNQMRESGLLHRNAKGEYTREPVETQEETAPIKKESVAQDTETKESLPLPQEPIVTAPVTPVTPEPTKSPLDIMGELAKRVRNQHLEIARVAAFMEKLMDASLQLAEEVEQAAITIQEQFESDAKELVELRELKATLKKFMG